MIRRDNTRSRRPGTRQAKERILAVCCGERTEKLYLDGMRRHFRDSPVAVCVKHDVGSPTQLVRQAAKLWQRDPDGFDQVWCVLDVDDFADLDQAVSLARRERVQLAVSNPCFEVWLLLHFADHKAHVNGAAAAMKLLRRHVTNYDKAALDFGTYLPGLSDAVERARLLAASHDDNPSTSMWRLAQAIRG